MLSIGDASTERPQLISYDPANPDEARDARRRYKALRRCGFVRAVSEPGRIALAPPPRASHLGVFRVLSQNGDDRIVWDRRDPGQVREAFQKFRDFVARGYTAFATLVGGKRGHRIDDFDPGLEEVLFVGQTVPG